MAVGPLTVLALVPVVVRWAAAGGLVAHVDGAGPPVGAVVLAGLQVAVGAREALQASAGRVPWERERHSRGRHQRCRKRTRREITRRAEPGSKIR